MAELRTLFNAYNKVIQNSQIGNHFPPRKYEDPSQIKYQRIKAQKKYARDPPTKKLDLTCKKGTFLQKIQKRESLLPSPTTYKPETPVPAYKQIKSNNIGDRSTITNDIIKECKKYSFPSPAQYNVNSNANDKKRCSSLVTFSKAEVANYLDDAASSSAQLPGIGEYNVRTKSVSKLGVWDKAKRQIGSKQNEAPGVGAYNLRNPAQSLFCQDKKISKSKLALQKRFDGKQRNENKKMFYCGISEWGLKTNYKKKDLLSVLSTHTTYQKSIYYR